MNFMDFYSPDYAIARDCFLAAAVNLRAEVTSHPFPVKGPSGESLTIDVARLGDPNPQRVVILSSGLHGVEGFFGSAIQLAWLRARDLNWSPPPQTSLILAHALNPFGFAWRRRWNEDNIDLNRNFLNDRAFLESDPNYQESRAAYNRLNSFLNPASPPSRWEAYPLKAIQRLLSEGYAARRRLSESKEHAPAPWSLPAIRDLGLLELQKTLPVGQYEHPTGLFYGGTQPAETVRTVRAALPSWVAGAGEVIHIDFHSGLGDFADYQMLLVDDKGSEGERWASHHFGANHIEAFDGRTAYAARGLMAEDLPSRLPNTRYHFLTAEFGTYSGARVLGALRAENRAHFFDQPDTASFRWAKQQIMEVFCPTSPQWRETVVKSGLAMIDQAIAACQNP